MFLFRDMTPRRPWRLSAPILVAGFVLNTNASDLAREHLSLDAGWKVHLGDDWPDAMHLENSGTGSGPAGERFADAYWRTVNLPHDWAVELPFDQTASVHLYDQKTSGEGTETSEFAPCKLFCSTWNLIQSQNRSCLT
jgi:hypothetical protein